MENLVSTDWLDVHLDDTDLVVLDCTNFAKRTADGRGYQTVSGINFWEKEHIARSGYVDFTKGMASDDIRYRNALPDLGEFAAAMGELGVGDQSRVVLYDSVASMWAARVWWMLRWIGFDNAAVLDGGWQSWKAEGRRTTSGHFKYTKANLTPQMRPELFVAKDDVLAALGDQSVHLIDALSEGQYNDQTCELGLSGHIPGAVNIPASSLVDPGTGRYLPLKMLAERINFDFSQRTIIYCGSGIAAASDAFTMTRLGYTDVAIYMPGLQEWVEDTDAPLVKSSLRSVDDHS